MTRIACRRLDSPLGPLLLIGGPAGLQQIQLPSGEEGAESAATGSDQIDEADPLSQAARQLREYFAGDRRAFDLTLDPQGTRFQQRVWRALSAIPYGQTVSYGELARWIGQPGAARAVGRANGSNPLPIVVPCHRVIAADGTLGGFSSGLAHKRRLLALEGQAPESGPR